MPYFRCKKCGQQVWIQSNKDQFQHEKVCKPNQRLMQQNGYAKQQQEKLRRQMFLSWWGL